MSSVAEFQNKAIYLANKDIKRLVKNLQKHKLWSFNGNLSSTTAEEYIKTIFFPNQKILNIVTYEISSIIKYLEEDSLKQLQKSKRPEYRIKLEKQIFDYKYEINKLKSQVIDYKTHLYELDHEKNTVQFEAFTQQWADAQQKLITLSRQLEKLEQILNPHPLQYGLHY